MQTCEIDFFFLIPRIESSCVHSVFFLQLKQANLTLLGLIFPPGPFPLHYFSLNLVWPRWGLDYKVITAPLDLFCWANMLCLEDITLINFMHTLSQHGPVRASDEYIFSDLPCVPYSHLSSVPNHVQPFKRVQVKHSGVECSSFSLDSRSVADEEIIFLLLWRGNLIQPEIKSLSWNRHDFGCFSSKCRLETKPCWSFMLLLFFNFSDVLPLPFLLGNLPHSSLFYYMKVLDGFRKAESIW